MRIRVTVIGFIGCASLAGCTPLASNAPTSLECAAVISAASHLMVRKAVAHDPSFIKQALASSMTHLNAYAIPKGLKEADAFAELNTTREKLMETRTPEVIARQARQCVRQTPSQGT